jgi:hypothetical protein
MRTSERHRLAVGQSMRMAEDFEQRRRDAHAPTSGADPGVTLDGMSAGDAARLGMDGLPDVPEPAVLTETYGLPSSSSTVPGQLVDEGGL